MGSKKKADLRSYKLFLQLDRLPASLNKKLRSHRFKNHKENKSWDMIIGLECSRKLPPYPLPRASISIVRHSHRMLDFDGLVGSVKPVVDALVTAGVLQDDNWTVTGRWNVDQRFRPKKDGPMLEILIQGLPEFRQA